MARPRLCEAAIDDVHHEGSEVQHGGSVHVVPGGKVHMGARPAELTDATRTRFVLLWGMMLLTVLGVFAARCCKRKRRSKALKSASVRAV